jgi:hypothetical protein
MDALVAVRIRFGRVIDLPQTWVRNPQSGTRGALGEGVLAADESGQAG